MTTATASEVTVTYRPRGAALALFSCRDGEVCLDGSAGTGKTMAALYKIHVALLKYPDIRVLVLRKTHVSLTSTALVTYEKEVLHKLDHVRFYGGAANKPAQYNYPRGGCLVVGGIDNAAKIMSSMYDIIYVNEATDLLISDWENLTTRLRHNKMPYQQLIGDCNPQYPEHWLNKRMQAGVTTRLISRHEDNPLLFDGQNTITPFGRSYMARLDALTGVRLLRLRKGIWAAAENTVYQDAWDANSNIIPRYSIPREWPRYLSVDFGYTHPFVCQWWAEDPDGRLILYREIYMTKRLVEDHVKQIIAVSRWLEEDGDPLPYKIIRDHDAEDGATFDRHLRNNGINIMTTPATKAVSKGIQAVAERMRPAGDGKPRLLVMQDCLVEVDHDLRDANLPYCTLHEIDMYVWNDGKDQPVKAFDHGLDAMRYVVATLDTRGKVTYQNYLYG